MNEVVILLLIIFPLANCQQSTSSQLNSTAACSDAYKYQSDSPIGQNIQTVFANLLRDAPATGYNSSTVGSSGNTVYGLLNCRGDISTAECRTCATAAVRILNNSCVRNSTKGGRVLLDTCSLRYEDHFFASTLDTVSDQSNCSSGANASAAYRANYDTAVTFLQNQVPTRPRKFVSTVAGFGTSSAVYVLGQCILDLSTTDCSACLTSARNVLSRSCPSGNSGFSYLPTCIIEFEGVKFFQSVAENATLSTPSKGGSSKGLAVGLPVGIGGALALAALGFWVYRMSHKGRKRLQRTPGELDELQATLHRGPVTFSYDLLRRVTQDFSDDYKLGEGGFGSVYKGTFSDGTEIAIKKLSVASKQGETQFLNEVKVISSVQHRNLVRLLGCCVEGTERLLVYEFLKNNSLENALFGSSDDKPQLSWEMRYNILMGTARGLTYLHEDSQVRIVHRDIKPSNILLDEAYEAKISDFGLARLYGEDETSEIITTKVAGTYGYMAPEYAFHGHLSEKADVFSFGIVMLETVTGRKNRDITLPGEQQYLLEWAWQLHSEGSLSNLIDPNLVNCEQKPILEVMHIAVMCTQGSPQARPSMSHVVAMLSGHSNVQVPLGGSFDFGALRPLSYVSQGTSSSAASNDPKRNQNQLKELSKTFSHPEPR